MRDITLKPTTLRSARASSFLTLPADTLARVRAGNVTKGDVGESARLAGLMAFKRTPDVLPHCHPIPILDADVEMTIEDDGLRFEAHIRTIAATGVEMEALTAASIAALTAYDMLKPHAPAEAMAIGDIRLLEKRGGKTDYKRALSGVRTVVLVLADAGRGEASGLAVRDTLQASGCEITAYEVLPLDDARIDERLRHHLGSGCECLFTIGATGSGPGDHAAALVAPLLTTPLPGIMETARAFGQARSPFAMLSNGVAGLAGECFVATLPGSSRGAQESLAAILPGLVHLFEVLRKRQACMP